MRQTILQNPIGLAALVSLATITAGCGQATALKADLTTGPAVTRVEVVKPGGPRSAGPPKNPGRSKRTR